LAADNQESWPLMQPLLANSTLKPSAKEIAYARDAFRELLTIRNSSRLFRMRSLEEVQVNLRFLNNGPSQLPGVIVMRLEANGKDYGPYRRVLVVFNARMEPASVEDPALQKLELHLHPVQASSSDQSVRESTYNPENGSVQVPALTTAVFVA
ncbi:MAG TPA: alpha-1,6-glucosidase domain-containing protein, partial [Bryobacteraceae bacterium]